MKKEINVEMFPPFLPPLRGRKGGNILCFVSEAQKKQTDAYIAYIEAIVARYYQ